MDSPTGNSSGNGGKKVYKFMIEFAAWVNEKLSALNWKKDDFMEETGINIYDLQRGLMCIQFDTFMKLCDAVDDDPPKEVLRGMRMIWRKENKPDR